MRYVNIAPNVRSSALGFGCASILGSVEAAAAKRALFSALDNGITHFDLARSYGFGKAERFVGTALKGERHKVTLVTKCGIEATALASVLSPLRPLVRRLRRWRRSSSIDAPRLSKPAPILGTGYLLGRVPLSGSSMQRSLHVSLRELMTEYVDVLLLHEPPDCGRFEELCEVATRLKEAGLVRAWGVSFMTCNLAKMGSLEGFDIVQHEFVDDPASLGLLHEGRKRAGRVVFSPLHRQSARVAAPRLKSAREALQSAANRYPGAVILSSMSSSEHVIQNCSAFEE